MAKHLILLVHRIFPILLFIVLAWGQENLDTLTYHNSSKFPGRFLGITFGGFEFEMIDKSVINKTFINDVQELSINSLVVIHNGQWVVSKEFVKDYKGNINQQSYDNYLIKEKNYQHDYQQGAAAAEKDWADSQRFYGILPPSEMSLFIKEKNQILVTDSQTPVPGFRDGYKKEMAKLKLKQNVKLTTTCCLLWVYFIGVEGFTEIFP